jgi:ABC-type glycerol-3-phosphate transport system substrate-binding protein
MSRLSHNQKIILGVVGIVVLILILIFLGLIPGLRLPQEKIKADLNFWAVTDNQGIYQQVTDQFQALHPGVRIIYRRFDLQTYEKDLINALAANRGPDIFILHNTWLLKHYDKISPLPREKLSFAVFKDQLFPQVVERDFTANEIIYALPLSLDTLSLIYNKDIFNQSGVALAPTTWTEFQNIIPKLRIIDQTGRLTRAAAAIGGSHKSIDRAADLLTVLMLQAGAAMTDQDFTRAILSLNALEFYTQFTDPANPNYTWNDSFRYSTDALAEGSVAMIFNYAEKIAELQTKNPFLNIGVAPLPQNDPANQINYANYWGYTVSQKSSYPELAWDFILLLTTNENNVKNYLQATNKPPALRSLIRDKQALTAKSWPQIDNNQIEIIFSNMIESVISGKQTAQTALSQAEAQITQLMKK